MNEQSNHQPMVAGRTTCACGNACGCSCHCHMGYHILRWALGIFILFFVFALGVKIGEFITELRYTVASGSYYGYGHGYYPMMGADSVGAPIPPATATNPATPAKTTP